jgi:hypothetical protein
MSNEPETTVAPFGVFHDAVTGEYIIRDLTQEEIDAIPDLSHLHE